MKRTDNPLVQKLLSGMAWNVMGTVFSKLFLMAALILTARILGVDQNGAYGVINSTVMMFSTFAGLGLGMTATRFVAAYKIKDPGKCGRIIGMTYLIGLISGIVMTGVLLGLSRWLAETQLHAPELRTGLMLASILLVTNTVNTVQISVLSGFERFKEIAKISLVQGLLALPVFVVFTLIWGMNGLIVGNILLGCAMLVLYGIENHKTCFHYDIKINFFSIKQESHILWHFSLPSMLSNVMVGPLTWVGNTFITGTKDGYFQLGIFNAANQWRSVLIFLPAAVGSVILPLIVANKGHEGLERINILLGWIIVNCVAIPLLAAPELISWLYGKDYAGAPLNTSLLLVIITCSMLAYKEGIARNLVSNNQMWMAFLSNALWGIGFLSLVWIGKDWGSVGIASAYLVSYTVTTVVFVPFYIRKGIVKRALMLSKEVFLMWSALCLQVVVSVVTQNLWWRGLSSLLSILALVQLIRVLLNHKQSQRSGRRVRI